MMKSWRFLGGQGIQQLGYQNYGLVLGLHVTAARCIEATQQGTRIWTSPRRTLTKRPILHGHNPCSFAGSFGGLNPKTLKP